MDPLASYSSAHDIIPTWLGGAKPSLGESLGRPIEPENPSIRFVTSERPAAVDKSTAVKGRYQYRTIG
ncbi:hypothetical protein N7462_007766 [Penicillium macrosclerotiorum]|uniref:uncharacterized protein n=1 Tax=Penicillium macrosclerotiorum TaxID=303699 RepID=UPI002547CA94|nr:uncharacterized protein N7462_007766 [Penicillium macrosclerotiorum]KAJ5679522.1 hypothetical protein N7462_007766 [Penicillium macrosclerotiorum]